MIVYIGKNDEGVMRVYGSEFTAKEFAGENGEVIKTNLY